MISKTSFTPSHFSRNNYFSPNFQGKFSYETIANSNIGASLNGYIGNITVRTGDNLKSLLKVYKSASANSEEYRILDKSNKIIGIMDMIIRKDYTNYYNPQPYNSHVFVQNLYNFSTPKTPYHNKALEKYKDIGTRLLQIALKRSEESGCSGNIKLIAKEESKPFYLNTIRMKEEFPLGSPERKFNNPNTMYLPQEFQEHLRNLQGGL